MLTEHGCTVAARTYRSWKQPGRPIATRSVSDAVVIDALRSVAGTLHGSLNWLTPAEYEHDYDAALSPEPQPA